MSTVRSNLHLELLERRDCPSSASLTSIINADVARLTTDLNKAATDFLSKAHVTTEARDAFAVLADTTRLALDVRAATHASLGATVKPLISLEVDEATLYYDFATGNTAGAKAAATKELNDLQQLGNALTGTANPGLAASVFNQAHTAFNNANNTLFGIGGGGGSGGGAPAA
jgi:hypothetical protein